MTTKYYPYYGGNFDRIVFDGDGSVWVPEVKLREVESENAKLLTLVRNMWDVALHPQLFGDGSHLLRRMRDLGIEVDE